MAYIAMACILVASIAFVRPTLCRVLLEALADEVALLRPLVPEVTSRLKKKADDVPRNSPACAWE